MNDLKSCLKQRHHKLLPWSYEWDKCEYCGTLVPINTIIKIKDSFEEWCTTNEVSFAKYDPMPVKWEVYTRYFFDEFGWDLSITKKRGSFYAKIKTVTGSVLYDSYLINKDYEIAQQDLVNQAFHIIKRDKL